MKNFTLRTSLALACAASLVACGGGRDDLILQIRSITGLTKDMTVRNNGGTPLTVAAGSTYFNFPGNIGEDESFNIEVATQPANATCTVYNGKGKTGAYSPNNIIMECIATPHNVTANVVGLTGTGLVVVNGTAQYTIPAGSTSFNFTTTNADGTKSGQVGDGIAYGFVVLTQPTNPAQNCIVQNGTGVMGSTDVVITIKCT
jgi:hypothetical protein